MTQMEHIRWTFWMIFLTWMSQCGHSYHNIYHDKAKSLVGHGSSPPLVLVLVYMIES